MPRLSISTWSLHRNLGPMYAPHGDQWDRLIPASIEPANLTLLDVPKRIAARGIHTLEICHFHFPRVDEDYIAELREALDKSGVELFSILIDSGDITNSDTARRERDKEWIRHWLDVASACGAKHARVIAGDAEESAEAVRLSARGLTELAEYARERGVRVITENFRRLTRRSGPLLEILNRCEGTVGLCADFGNFSGPTKYDDLAAILPRADSVHAKAHYPAAGQMDQRDFLACLELSRKPGFDGPYSLIFDGPGDEWESLAEIQDVVKAYVQ